MQCLHEKRYNYFHVVLYVFVQSYSTSVWFIINSSCLTSNVYVCHDDWPVVVVDADEVCSFVVVVISSSWSVAE